MAEKTLDKILAVLISLPMFIMCMLDVVWYHNGIQTFEMTIINMFFYLITYLFLMTIIALIMLFRGEE